MKVGDTIEFNIWYGRRLEGVVRSIWKDANGWHIRVCYSVNGDEVVIEPERVKGYKKVKPWEAPKPEDEENVEF